MKASTYKEKLIERVSTEATQPIKSRSAQVSEKTLLEALGSPETSMNERLAALLALKAMTFASPTYTQWREELFTTLREIVSKEGKTVLAFPALETLAQEKDEWALAKLEAILRSPRGAELSAFDALRLLAYDDHGSHFDALREIAPNQKKGLKIRLAAIRQLGSDPQVSNILANMVEDQQDDPQIRRQALVALRNIDRDRYNLLANSLISDDSEDDQVRAQCITALKIDGASANVEKTLRKMQVESSSEIVRVASESYFQQSEQ